MSFRSSFKEVKPGSKQPLGGKPEAGSKRGRDIDAIPDAPSQPPAARQQQGASFTDHDLHPEERALRAFDLSSKYGPCAGLTRLERWERAHKFGLDPPADIKLLLDRFEPQHARNQAIWSGRI